MLSNRTGVAGGGGGGGEGAGGAGAVGGGGRTDGEDVQFLVFASHSLSQDIVSPLQDARPSKPML